MARNWIDDLSAFSRRRKKSQERNSPRRDGDGARQTRRVAWVEHKPKKKRTKEQLASINLVYGKMNKSGRQKGKHKDLSRIHVSSIPVGHKNPSRNYEHRGCHARRNKMWLSVTPASVQLANRADETFIETFLCQYLSTFIPGPPISNKIFDSSENEASTWQRQIIRLAANLLHPAVTFHDIIPYANSHKFS